jgi:hypothetical protein
VGGAARRLAPGGLLVEGTCDEVGRRAAWVALDAGGPRTLTLAAHLPSLPRPSELAERLPKALIHHNVPGQPVHDLLAALRRPAWDRAAPSATFGAGREGCAACEEARMAQTGRCVTGFGGAHRHLGVVATGAISSSLSRRASSASRSTTSSSAAGRHGEVGLLEELDEPSRSISNSAEPDGRGHRQVDEPRSAAHGGGHTRTVALADRAGDAVGEQLAGEHPLDVPSPSPPVWKATLTAHGSSEA